MEQFAVICYGVGRQCPECGRPLQFNSGAFPGLWGSYQDRIATKWFLLDRVLSLWENEPINSKKTNWVADLLTAFCMYVSLGAFISTNWRMYISMWTNVNVYQYLMFSSIKVLMVLSFGNRHHLGFQRDGLNPHQWPLLLTWINFNPSMDK